MVCTPRKWASAWTVSSVFFGRNGVHLGESGIQIPNHQGLPLVSQPDHLRFVRVDMIGCDQVTPCVKFTSKRAPSVVDLSSTRTSANLAKRVFGSVREHMLERRCITPQRRDAARCAAWSFHRGLGLRRRCTFGRCACGRSKRCCGRGP